MLNLLLFTALISCSSEKSENAQIQQPESSVADQRLQLLRADLNGELSTEQQVVGEEAEHPLTVVYLHRASSAEVHAPDRAMTRMAFFWDEEIVPIDVIDLVASDSYEWWWEDQVYTVEFELLEADFSLSVRRFELNGQSSEIELLREGVQGYNEGDRRQHACQFNRGMLNFAWQHLEQRVGDGECWTLIDEALRTSQAHPAAHYRFGSFLTSGSVRESADWSIVLPGDVIQFDQGRFEGEHGTWSAGSPNHTAMIRSLANFPEVSVYEQNSPVGGPTVINYYHLNELQSGEYYLYRAIPLDERSPVEFCDQPAATLFAYEAHVNNSSDGSELFALALSEAAGNEIEWCQWHCDSTDNCAGFELEAEDCVLKSVGQRMQQQGATWFQKCE